MHPSRPARKRKAVSYHEDGAGVGSSPVGEASPKKSKITKETFVPSPSQAGTPSPKQAAAASTAKTEERRLRRFRPNPPQSYLEIKRRALTQRLTVISRERRGTHHVPEERILIAGTTGNVYTQNIGLVPRCDCPHAIKGNQCKHIIYIMLKVLKAREEVAYQLALTSEELREVIGNAAPIPGANSEEDAAAEQQEDGNRKPIEGECPICYSEFDPDHEAIIYCETACGNNVHRDCMHKWMTVKGGKATCPYCRMPWADSGFDAKTGKVDLTTAEVGEDGYRNVASQIGLSGIRDYSTYHQVWARSRGYV